MRHKQVCEMLDPSQARQLLFKSGFFLFWDLVCRGDHGASPLVFVITLILLPMPLRADIPVTVGLGCCCISISLLMYCCTRNDFLTSPICSPVV